MADALCLWETEVEEQSDLPKDGEPISESTLKDEGYVPESTHKDEDPVSESTAKDGDLNPNLHEIAG